ncbi:MAG: AAA family ATPase, partial [Legionella sp.]|nr:AAA family ATPase [Legionella sp.]
MSSTTLSAPRLLVHGVAGVGKTFFAAASNSPAFILCEDGLGVLKAPHFPLARSYGDVIDALAALHTEDHEFKTVVVDSVDWLE